MSRFGTDMDFFYQNNGSNFFAGTVLNLTAGQMPQYPFEEYRLSDKVFLRNLNGDLVTFQNYNKAGYKLKWTYLDESKAIEMRNMIDSSPYMSIFSNGTNFGTFVLNGAPTFSEVQFELYDIDIEIQEV